MPTLKNIVVNPEITLMSNEQVGPNLQRATLRAVGLMCYTFCEARSHSAIGRLPGVSKVEFQTEPDRFIVEYDPSKVGFQDFRRAVVGEVVGRPFRIALARFGNPAKST